MFHHIMPEQDAEFNHLRRYGQRVSVGSLANLYGNVGRDQRNRRSDVAKIELMAERNGVFDTKPTDGPTGLFSSILESAVKDFQKHRNLKNDGLITPGGETVRALRKYASADGNETPDIEREILPPPLIPGTNIPDQGIPEGYVPEYFLENDDLWRYKMDEGIIMEPPAVDFHMQMRPEQRLRMPRKRL